MPRWREAHRKRLAGIELTSRPAHASPKELIAQVRTFRRRRQYDQESEAYAYLLEQALDAAEREERERQKGKPR
jgi:hypothetical protein